MRITGGEWRSRALKAPRGTATRPTSDRVREALFSMLASDGALDSAPKVLDLYAGTGALALEALSRGASRAVCVEQARDALAVLRENVKSLDANVVVVASKVDRALDSLKDERFDLVFADPPYADVKTAEFARTLLGAVRRLEEGGILVLEHASKDEAPSFEGVLLYRNRTYGDTSLSFYRPDV